VSTPKKPQKRKKAHPFSGMPEFDQAMRRIAAVPKEQVEKLERESRTPRKKGGP
jgi:hypothetical protein